jgi:hypothetical protein
MSTKRMTKEEKALLRALAEAKGIKLTREALCALAHMYQEQNPSGQGKLLELAFEHENKEFVTRDEKQGVDLIHKETKEAYELKTVTCGRDKQGTANFVFPVQKNGESIADYRKRVAKVQKAKGKLIIEVVVVGEKTKKIKFTFSADFIAGFLSSFPKIEAGRVGICVNMCRKCGDFHKLQYLLKLSKELEEGPQPASYWEKCHKEVRGCQK